MRVAVCIKQVPDTEAQLRIAADGLSIDEEELPFLINGSDEYALEEGLQIAERTGGEVVVFTLGPPRVSEALRKALALGAARAVHLADEAYQGGDALVTGNALAAAIGAESFDLVLTGSQSDDAGWGSTGSVVAERLGWPHSWLVMGVDVDQEAGVVEVTREMEAGVNEISRLALPAVLEIQAGLNQPRYASLRGIMQAKRKEIAQPAPGDLGFDPGDLGAAGAKVELLSIAFPDTGKGTEFLEGDGETMARQLVDKLRREARVVS